MSEEISQILASKLSLSVSDSVLNKKNTNTKTLTLNTRTVDEVHDIAQKIEATLGKQIPSRFTLYCKYAWRLSEAKIFANLETAITPNPKVRNPQALFTWLCEQDMKKAQS